MDSQCQFPFRGIKDYSCKNTAFKVAVLFLKFRRIYDRMSIAVWKYHLIVKSEDLCVCGTWRQHMIHFRCDHEAQQNCVQSNILGMAVRLQRAIPFCRSSGLGTAAAKYTSTQCIRYTVY